MGTNALIQRRGARVGLIMTRGFENTTLITRGPIGKNLGIPPTQAMDFIHNERPPALVPKTLIRPVAERVALDGEVVAPLKEDEVYAALEDLVRAGVESLAVCLLWSFRNEAHEKRIKEIAGQMAPSLQISLSSEISPMLGEFERAVTTVVNSYIGPVLVRYINRLQTGLEEMSLGYPVQLMRCSGGLTLPQHVGKQAVSLINSGPVGGLVASRYLGETLGFDNVITTDMGGTSFDVGVIYRGEYEYEQAPFLSQGIPVQIPAVKVVTIGAGGGSIAWSDGRRLMVGPQSAGADPGPAAYDRGGTEPTVTDALVVLGLLDPDYFFGGRTNLKITDKPRLHPEPEGDADPAPARKGSRGVYLRHVGAMQATVYDGELLLWVGNVLHHADLAGIDEGSFCINAVNVYQEAPRYFLKLAARGKISKEVERTFSTNSRLPDMVALDLKAQLGAVNVAKRRLRELIEQRGAETVLSVMRQSIDYAEQELRAVFTALPDGSWSTAVYMDTDRVGSDRVVEVRLRLDKRGDELFFDYTGTGVQSEGAVNCTYPACYAGTTTPIYTFLCGGDIDWNGSIKRCVQVHAPEGTVMNARYPAAVSICSIGFSWMAAVASMKVLARMLSESDRYRDRVCPSWGSSCNANNIFGVNRRGRTVGALLSDHRGVGAGARSFADGIDHAGQIFSYLSFMSNVESQEWKLPLLYAFRKQLTDSGGPGTYRGGLTAMVAVAPYKTERLIMKSQNTAGADESNAASIHGGFPGAGSQVSVIGNTRLWEKLGRGEIPLTYEEFGGQVEHLPSKSQALLGRDDVLVFYAPGGGYGDPLERDPQRVGEDVRSGPAGPAAHPAPLRAP